MGFTTKVTINRERLEQFKKIKKLNALIFLLVFLILIIVIVICFKSGKNVGNSIGNIRNYGYMAKSGKWIYYVAPSEDGNQTGIYKIKEGDQKLKSKKQLVMDDWDIYSLNVSGNYIYFIGISGESYSGTDAVDNKIYRIKKNGKDLEIINDNEINNECYEMYVVGNKIYYIGDAYNVYTMNLDGKKKECILENGKGYLGVTDKYIIYNLKDKNSDSYVTYISNLKGRKARPIIENTRLLSVNIEKDYVYYTDENKSMYRVKVNGKKQKLLSEANAYNMNVSDGYIYYLDFNPENASQVCIYKIKANGSSKEPICIKVLEQGSNFLDVADNWLFYMDRVETNGNLNLLKTNGKKLIPAYSVNVDEIIEGE